MYPVYKPDGTTLAYSNPHLTFGSQGYQSYLFVQCQLLPPDQEESIWQNNQETNQCRTVADFGVLVPAGFIGDIIGSYPVWTANDQIAYNGCNTWAGGGSCGIFVVGSWATKRTSNGETPHKLIDGISAIPTDSKAGLIVYHAHETGDWEAYVVSQTGGESVNISNSPTSNDGLPTLSPDGQWVAFASDRSGSWAIYVTSTGGGPAQKLFEFPKSNPWATGDREWINERMSWGP